MSERISKYSDFWRFYVSEHSQVLNRRLHFVGTSLGILFFVAAVVFQNPWLVLCGLVSGYAFAWVGHFFVEKNRPATFKYPLWSFISDFRMWYLMLLRKEIL